MKSGLLNLLSGIASLACALPAFAADVPQSAPAAPPSAAPAQPSVEITYSSDVRFYTWTGTRGFDPRVAGQGRGSGVQLYTPTSIQLKSNLAPNLSWEALVRSGYVYSRQSTSGFQGQASTPVDTSVTNSFTYNGFTSFQPFATVTVNLPTGKSALFGTDARARMDPDLVELATFGEGFNVGPTAGVNILLAEGLMASLGAGYTFRGTYEREAFGLGGVGIFPTSRFNPGDVFTPTVSLGYQVGTFALIGSFAFSTETDTRTNGLPVLETGNRYAANLGISYGWTDNWASSLTATFVHTDPNKVENPAGVPRLVREVFNSNSNVFRVQFEHLYREATWSVGPSVNFLFRDENAYNPVTAQFTPAKTRVGAGFVGSYAASDALNFTARVERVWLHENERVDFLDPAFGIVIPGSGVPSLSHHGWAVTLGGNARF